MTTLSAARAASGASTMRRGGDRDERFAERHSCFLFQTREPVISTVDGPASFSRSLLVVIPSFVREASQKHQKRLCATSRPSRDHVCLNFPTTSPAPSLPQSPRAWSVAPVFPRLLPRFRWTKRMFPDIKLWRLASVRRYCGFALLASHYHLEKPASSSSAGSAPYRGSRAACAPESAADRSEKSPRGHSSHHLQKRSLRWVPYVEQKISS